MFKDSWSNPLTQTYFTILDFLFLFLLLKNSITNPSVPLNEGKH
ncbi:MAG: hypothetical protein BAJALOKI1v1_2060002 [Promethearchaeota archaeon]|nr:MAG: hypothetical protein BAJALOKI1v1_2060002 [Candidatus Lokiarchaeota archaeon]